ncbi:MAG: lysoplasmalogenase [Bacteroidales bacterium]|nr:lysoplasmalogenase [Bacteroidales bacterium]
MKNSRLWLVPLCFFVVCCALNLTGCFISDVLKATVKPALMPLLCVTTLAWLLPRLKGNTALVGLLVSAQLFGFAGDTLLIPDGFLFFAGGIGSFLVGHIFYITLFGGRHSFKGLKAWQWIAGIAAGAAATAALILIIGVNGALLPPMAVYGFTLMMLIFSALCGALRFGGCAWWTILCGALLFTFSDSLIAINTFKGLSPFMSGFGVMSTYLVAQSLLAIGSCKLILQSPRQV